MFLLKRAFEFGTKVEEGNQSSVIRSTLLTEYRFMKCNSLKDEGKKEKNESIVTTEWFSLAAKLVTVLRNI